MSEMIYTALLAGGLSHVGACAMLGNLEAESSLRANNLQNSYEKSFGVGDEAYTLAVDSGVYKNFANDRAGYGLAQWTYPERKRRLLEFVKSRKASIGDAKSQVAFALQELESEYAELYDYLCSDSAQLYNATARICKEYERPAVNNIEQRYYYAQKWDEYFSLKAPAKPGEDRLEEVLMKLEEILRLLREAG